MQGLLLSMLINKIQGEKLNNKESFKKKVENKQILRLHFLKLFSCFS